MKTYFFLAIFCVACFSACDKKNEDNSVLNSFTGLTAEKDTIFTGQSTKITAVYDGTDVTFQWQASAGDLLGSGSQVTYVAPPCVPGNNTITCTASASNDSETKTIVITVF